MTKSEEPPETENICLSPSCVLAASEILENMSPRYHEIDPCIDFDKFVCEGWAEKHDLRADQGGAFTGTIMAENSQTILRHVLESPYPMSSQDFEIHSVAKQKIFEKLHDAYEACMGEEKLKELGSAPLLDVLRKIEEMFPAKRPSEDSEHSSTLSNQNQKGLLSKGENELSKTMAYLISIGVGALVRFDVGVSCDEYSHFEIGALLIFPRLMIKILMLSFNLWERLAHPACQRRSITKTHCWLHGTER